MADAVEQESGQYLTFTLDEEVYAFNIQHVREVLDYTRITRVPKMPEYMLGVINLRGGVVPVLDLGRRFGLPQKEATVETCIIIIEMQMEGEVLLLGTLADSVKEVLSLDASQIEPAPRIGMRLDTEFIKGMGKKDEIFIIILDIDRILSVDELMTGRQIAGDQEEDMAADAKKTAISEEVD